MKESILLISGCSNAAGAEIDGSQDSLYNRQNSFGNLLAAKLGRQPVNIALSGSSNQGISRTILEWFGECYDPTTMDLAVLVAWSESARLELPMSRVTWYETWNTNADYVSKASRDYIRVNFGYKGDYEEERRSIEKCQEFMSNNLTYMEILSANLVLQLEYFFKYKQIDYLMCNTMHMFSEDSKLDFYLNQIDQTRYMNIRDNNQSFYAKYKNLGYQNPKATYWHHNEDPHRLYANDLYDFWQTKYNIGS